MLNSLKELILELLFSTIFAVMVKKSDSRLMELVDCSGDWRFSGGNLDEIVPFPSPHTPTFGLNP